MSPVLSLLLAGPGLTETPRTYANVKCLSFACIDSSSLRFRQADAELVFLPSLSEASGFDAFLECCVNIMRFPSSGYAENILNSLVPFFFVWAVREVLFDVTVESGEKICKPLFHVFMGDDIFFGENLLQMRMVKP